MIQVFDSWAGSLAPDDYDVFAMPYQKMVVAAIKKKHPEVRGFPALAPWHVCTRLETGWFRPAVAFASMALWPYRNALCVVLDFGEICAHAPFIAPSQMCGGMQTKAITSINARLCCYLRDDISDANHGVDGHDDARVCLERMKGSSHWCRAVADAHSLHRFR